MTTGTLSDLASTRHRLKPRERALLKKREEEEWNNAHAIPSAFTLDDSAQEERPVSGASSRPQSAPAVRPSSGLSEFAGMGLTGIAKTLSGGGRSGSSGERRLS